mmetsp:Transcript_51588/g.122751  ORF Transcript_51588/g.122751 Transcript_51588/m.122751 type:complete len:291 (+) Transcript_51588:153-1025(+)
MSRKITRGELEELSNTELQQLISEAVSVMAARADSGSTTSDRLKSQAPPGQAAALFSSTTAAARQAPSSRGSIFTTSGTAPSTLSGSGGIFGTYGSATVAPGSLFTFGSASSGSSSKGDKALAKQTADGEKQATAGEGESDGEAADEEEVTTVQGWSPSITLEVRDQIEFGDEDEEQLYAQRSKLFRWREGEWKERGIGEARLLKSKASGHVRFLMRQEKTGKIVANHSVIKHETYCDLRPNSGSDKIWCWSALDYADEAAKVEEFGLKFGNAELANAFKEAFDGAKFSL